MEPSVGRAVGMCLQADDKQLLNGDTCITRTVAKSVVVQFGKWEESVRLHQKIERIEDILEIYVKLNFPEVHQEIERKRLAERDDEFTLDNIEAENMDEMLDKIRAVAGML